MSYFVKQGNFALNTSTGNQSVTGLGFQPKLLLFYSNMNSTSDGVVVNAGVMFGAATSSTNRFCVDTSDDDSANPSVPARTHILTNCIVYGHENIVVPVFAADFVSMDADGFTINITFAPASGRVIHYLAFGGSELTNVSTGSFTAPASTGDQSVAVGFQPDAVLFATIATNTAPPISTGFGNICIGMATSSSNRGFSSLAVNDNQSTSGTYLYQRNNKCIGIVNPTNGTVFIEADFVSMDANGFTVNWSTTSTGRYIFYVALSGGFYHVGNLTTQTSTGNFSQTGVGFKPSGGLFVSNCAASSASVQDGYQISLGAVSSTSARGVIGATSEDNVSPADADSFQDSDKLYKNYDYAQSVEGEIDFVSWDNDGFTLNQSDADPTGNEVLYLVAGGVTRRVFITQTI